jgi:hypothetical protein
MAAISAGDLRRISYWLDSGGLAYQELVQPTSNDLNSVPPDVAAVESLVTPAPTWQCGTQPTYTAATGKVDFTTTVSDCP